MDERRNIPVMRVHSDQIDVIVEAGGADYLRGLYLAAYRDEGRIYWRAVNNVRGNAACADFSTEKDALAWLGGAQAPNRYGELCNTDGSKNAVCTPGKRRMTWEEYLSVNNTPAFRDIKNRK